MNDRQPRLDFDASEPDPQTLQASRDAEARRQAIDRRGGLGLVASGEDDSGKNCDERPPQHRSDCIEFTGYRCLAPATTCTPGVAPSRRRCLAPVTTATYGFQSGRRSLPGPVVRR